MNFNQTCKKSIDSEKLFCHLVKWDQFFLFCYLISFRVRMFRSIPGFRYILIRKKYYIFHKFNNY